MHDAIITAIAVLIITCPCALALAIPAVQVVASGALFRSDVILNAGDAIERLAETDTVVFDKTGTLTLPEPRVVNAAALDPELLQMAARLALSSRHPLAVALSREATTRVPFDDAVEEPGQGVRARLSTLSNAPRQPPILRCRHACIAGIDGLFPARKRFAVIAIAQKLRPDAVELCIRCVGEGSICAFSPATTPRRSRRSQTPWESSWQGGLKPAEKIARILKCKAHGRRVAMVGDGLNDAPSLAAAHVSLSPISAADVTQAQADAVFLGEKLKPVLDAILLPPRARADDAKSVAGHDLQCDCRAGRDRRRGNASIAALAMSGSSLLVTLNAMRAGGRRQ